MRVGLARPREHLFGRKAHLLEVVEQPGALIIGKECQNTVGTWLGARTWGCHMRASLKGMATPPPPGPPGTDLDSMEEQSLRTIPYLQRSARCASGRFRPRRGCLSPD